MRKVSTDFLLTGGYGSNLGDDAMLISILLELTDRFSGSTIIVFCYNKDNIPEEAKESFPNVTYFDRSDKIDITANFRIYGGGNQHFTINSSNAVKDELLRKIKFQFNNSREFLFTFKKRFGKANLKYRKSIYLGIGLGPFKIMPDLSYLDDALVILREKLSLTYHKDAILGCDPCFNPLFIDKIIKDKEVLKDNVKPNIGIVVRDWYHDFERNKEIFDSIQKYINILSPFYKITIINFCSVLDFQYRSVLVNYDDEIIYDSRKNHFFQFVRQISNMNMVISMRYHGLVFASILNIPSIGLNIDPKIEQFTKEFDSPYLKTIEIGENEEIVLNLINSTLKAKKIDVSDIKVADFFVNRYKIMIDSMVTYIESND